MRETPPDTVSTAPTIAFAEVVVGADLAAALAAEGLPTDDLALPGRTFHAIRDNGDTLGWIGHERLGDGAVLLRSLVILPACRRRGHARAALVWLLRRLAAQGHADAFALTTSAAVVAMLEALGFAAIPRDRAPPALAATRQFSSLCPAAAVVLHRRIVP